MKSKSSQNSNAGILFIISTSIGIFTNIATGLLPDYAVVKPYLWLSFPLLGIAVIVYLFIQGRPDNNRHNYQVHNDNDYDYTTRQPKPSIQGSGQISNQKTYNSSVSQSGQRDWISIGFFTLYCLGGMFGLIKGILSGYGIAGAVAAS